MKEIIKKIISKNGSWKICTKKELFRIYNIEIERRQTMDNLQVTNHDFLIYKDKNGEVNVNVLLINHDLWLTQNLIAELFGVSRSTITDHINNIFKTNELEEKTSVGISDESTGGRKAKIYNLDVIIAVGYRVNSKKATNFRIWATKVLKEYMIKGAVIDEERLKNPNYVFGEDYFEETLEKIRNIRTSERRFYQKITDIYSQCSVDYDKYMKSH